MIKRGKVQEWSDHLNNMDPTGSIKFTHEEEKDNAIAFLDTLLERRQDDSVKLDISKENPHQPIPGIQLSPPPTSEDGDCQDFITSV